MLNMIRGMLICAVVSGVAVGALQEAAPQSGVIVSNQYVEITRFLPATPPARDAAPCTNPNGNPVVWLSLPDRMNAAPSDGPRAAETGRASAHYALPNSTYKCASTQGATIVDIELKSQPAAGVFNDDAVKLDPAHNEVLLENDQVRVVRIHFPPGESGPIVDKRARIICALTDSRATVAAREGQDHESDMKAGMIVFSRGGRQSTKNVGTALLENIVVELKGK